jgi:hypothetical protein
MGAQLLAWRLHLDLIGTCDLGDPPERPCAIARARVTLIDQFQLRDVRAGRSLTFACSNRVDTNRWRWRRAILGNSPPCN